jgi:MYXO-CTERM domain-containing protein
MNQVNWNGSSAWTLNNSGGSVLSLFDNGGVQAKLESLGTGGVTINAPVTFAATVGANWAEINAVSSNISFGSGTLNVSGSAVNGVRMFGGNGLGVTFQNTVAATGKYFAFTNANTQSATIAAGANVTSNDWYVMNNATLNLAGGSLTTTAVRLGGDFGTTGSQNQTLAATLALTPAAGGVSFGSTINAVSGNTSGNLRIDSQNTSGTNNITSGVFLDSDLRILQAAGGTLAFSTGTFDVKSRQLLVNSSGSVSIGQTLASSNAAGGTLVKQGSGTLTLGGTSNTYTGTSSSSLNANGTQIAAGTLAIAADTSLGLAPAGAYNNVQFTGSGTLRANASISLNANRNVSIASGQTATFDNNGNTFTINGIVNGAGGNVASTGVGTTIFTGNNSYTGATTISAGTLEVTANNALGTAAAGTTVDSGAALKLTSVNYSTAEAVTINGTGVSSGGALVNSGTSTFAGQITAATNATIKAGGGTLNLTGGLVKNGTVLTLTGGGFVNINTTGISGASANSDLIVDAVSVTLNAASSYNGPTYVRNAGTLVNAVNNGMPTSPRSAVILDDSGSGNSSINFNANGQIASLTGAASSTMNSLVGTTTTIGTSSGTTTFNGTLGLTGSLVKDGASTQVLTGSSFSSGGTTISAGVLELNNTTGSATGSGQLTVNSGATLSGTGRVATGFSNGVLVNGTFIVGSTIGAATVADFEIDTSGSSGSTVFGNNSTLKFDLFSRGGDLTAVPTAADSLIINGSLSLLSNVVLEISNPSSLSGWAAGDKWNIWDVSGTATGTIATLNAPALGNPLLGWQFSESTGVLEIIAVPEPSKALFAFLGLFGLFLRRRR